MALTKVKNRNTKPALKSSYISDAHGLYLEVKPIASKLGGIDLGTLSQRYRGIASCCCFNRSGSPTNVVHSKLLSGEEISAFSQSLEESGGLRTTYIALRLSFVEVTFVGTKELRASSPVGIRSG